MRKCLGDVVGEVGGQRRFAHARPARENDQIGGLQAPHAGVKIGQSSCKPGKAAVTLISPRRHIDRGREGLGKALEAGIKTSRFGDFVKLALGILDMARRRGVDRRVVGEVDHILADRDQIAADREVIDGAAEILGIDDRGRLGGEPRQVLIERKAGDIQIGRQERLQGHRRRQLVGADQTAGKLKDLPMNRLEEMLWLKEVGDAVERLVIDQDRAQQRLLSLDIMRRRAKRRFRRNLFARYRIECCHGPDLGMCLWPILGWPVLCHSTSRITQRWRRCRRLPLPSSIASGGEGEGGNHERLVDSRMAPR